ncbi:hypothetical protein VNI00_016682 [Paramarasmius palmivorus]|uniref:Uncharacterized protein n=1 Tax=Paramarasmius palmivorus TaxID=297713 RepID=A0AAW0BDZ9_9AGAR
MSCTCQDKPDNFGGVLSGGIQNVSALLPLLGTEQCERHTGSALEKGWLYASATVLSLFGCLGIAKVGVATLLATLVIGPFYGMKWLSDAGFSTRGSVSSMVTLDRETGQYGAEAALKKLLKDKHIDDVNSVKGVSFSTVKKVEAASIKARGDGLTESLRVMKLRMIRRIHRIVEMSLVWMQAEKKHGLEADQSKDVLERRICNRIDLQSKPNSWRWRRSSKPPSDAERAIGEVNSPVFPFFNDSLSSLSPLSSMQPEPKNSLPIEDSEVQRLCDLLKTDWGLLLDQIIIFVSIPMIVAGYVGCFSLVGQSEATGAPYLWLGLESVLSIIRMFLWGWNPGWDEGTGLTLSLKLKETENIFPRVTSPCHAEELGLTGEKSLHTFILQTEADFLRSAAACIGPLQRFESSAPIALFYSILIKNRRKCLYTTVSLANSRRSITFTTDEKHPTIFATTIMTNPLTGTVSANAGERALPGVDPFIDTDLYRQVVTHSRLLNHRLFCGRLDHNLFVKWNLISSHQPQDADSRACEFNKSLHDIEGRYIDVRLRRILKSQIYLSRGIILATRHVLDSPSGASWDSRYPRSLHDEILLLAESFLLECMIWEEERPVGNEKECIQAMQLRVSKEKEEAITRYRAYSWDTLDGIEHHMAEDWNRALHLLIQLRISENHRTRVTPFLEAWKHLRISAIVENYPLSFWHRKPLAAIMRHSRHSDMESHLSRLLNHMFLRVYHITTADLRSIISTGFLRRDLRPESTLRGPYVHAAGIDALKDDQDWRHVTSLQLSEELLQKVLGRCIDIGEDENEDVKEARRYILPPYITTLIVVETASSSHLQQELTKLAKSNPTSIHTHHPMQITCAIQSDQTSFPEILAWTKQDSGLDEVSFDMSDVPPGCGEVLISAVPLKASGRTETYWLDYETNPFSHTWEIHGPVNIQWTPEERDSSVMQTGSSHENPKGDDKAREKTMEDPEHQRLSSMGQHSSRSAHIEDTETGD